MAKNPVITLDQIIKLLSPKVVQVVKEHSVRLWQQVIIRHLTGGTTSDRLGRRSGTLARSTRPIPVKMEGSKVTGGLSFGAEYAWTHIGPAGSQVTIRPKNKRFLAIPLAAAKTAAGVARGRPPVRHLGPHLYCQGGDLRVFRGDQGQQKRQAHPPVCPEAIGGGAPAGPPQGAPAGLGQTKIYG